MFLFFLFANAKASDLGAEVTMEYTGPLSSFSDYLFPGVENNIKIYGALSQMNIGLALSFINHSGLSVEDMAYLGMNTSELQIQGDSFIFGFGPYASYDINLYFLS